MKRIKWILKEINSICVWTLNALRIDEMRRSSCIIFLQHFLFCHHNTTQPYGFVIRAWILCFHSIENPEIQTNRNKCMCYGTGIGESIHTMTHKNDILEYKSKYGFCCRNIQIPFEWAIWCSFHHVHFVIVRLMLFTCIFSFGYLFYEEYRHSTLIAQYSAQMEYEHLMKDA